jgi:hypothetical protein
LILVFPLENMKKKDLNEKKNNEDFQISAFNFIEICEEALEALVFMTQLCQMDKPEFYFELNHFLI